MISASITAYSTAVGPSSETIKRFTLRASAFMVCPLLKDAFRQPEFFETSQRGLADIANLGRRANVSSGGKEETLIFLRGFPASKRRSLKRPQMLCDVAGKQRAHLAGLVKSRL